MPVIEREGSVSRIRSGPFAMVSRLIGENLHERLDDLPWSLDDSSNEEPGAWGNCIDHCQSRGTDWWRLIMSPVNEVCWIDIYTVDIRERHSRCNGVDS
jgi:hypothetical protein